MRNNKFKNAPIYLLALANLIYALEHGFTWLHIFTFAITAIVLVLDILEVLHDRHKAD